MPDVIDPSRGSIICLRCDDEIQSAYRHDFHYCRCGHIAVDGGSDYLKVVGREWKYLPSKNHTDFIDEEFADAD